MATPGDRPDTPKVTTVHASCVAVLGRAVLIRGASGQGKSALALDLMTRGAGLVADDRTRLWRERDVVMADAPDTIRGQIEARGVGILAAPPAGPVPLALIVDLDESEGERLPPRREDVLLGVQLPVLWRPQGLHFAAAIVLYLKEGRVA